MSIDPKPRVQIDLKTIMLIMAFFGAGTWGGVILFARKAAWWLVEPPMTAAVDSIVPKERARTDSVVKAALDSVRIEGRSRFKRLEDILEEMPGGKSASRRVREKESSRRNMFGSIPSTQEIVIF
jgi:hypothetical protein